MDQPGWGHALHTLPMTHQLSCLATALAVRDLMAQLHQALSQQAVGVDLQCAVGIAVTEGLNNIVEHALPGRPHDVIGVELSVNAVQILVQLQDGGTAMPTCHLPEAHPANLSVPRADLPEGGFGWTMIRTLTNQVDYCRVNGVNRLRMWFHNPSEAPACSIE